MADKSRNLHFLKHVMLPHEPAEPLSKATPRSFSKRFNSSRALPRDPPSGATVNLKPSTAFQQLATRTLGSEAWLPHLNTVRDFDSFREYFPEQTVAENRRIRSKLTEYNRLAKAQETASDPNVVMLDSAIRERLQEQATRINVLLAKESSVKNITPLSEEQVSLETSAKHYSRIRCSLQSVPLVVRVMVSKGAGHVVAYLSLTADRPNHNSNDKSTVLTKKTTYISLSESNSKAIIFSHDYIYFTFEAERESSFVYECSFGRSNQFKSRYTSRELEQEQRTLRTHNAVPRIRDVETLLQKIVSNPEQLEQCNSNAARIREKRQKRYLQLSGQVDIMQRNRTMGLAEGEAFVRNLHASSTVGFMKLTVEDKRERVETEELMRKFLLSHRWEIIKKHDILVKRKKQEIDLKNRRVRMWVALIKASRLAKYLTHMFGLRRELYLENQRRMYSLTRIQIAIISRLKHHGPTFMSRVGKKVASYKVFATIG